MWKKGLLERVAAVKLLQQDLKGIGEALAGGKQKLLFVVVFAAVWAGYALFTDIYSIPLGGFNPLLKPVDAGLITVIALLTSLIITLMAYTIKTNLGTRGKKRGILGSTIGLFATACPICQPIWLVWLGLGSQALFLVEISTYVSLASIALLLVSLHFMARGIADKTCEAPEIKKQFSKATA